MLSTWARAGLPAGRKTTTKLLARDAACLSPLRHKSQSSQDWLRRHGQDPFVKQAQAEGYRARSAYKLLEIQERFGVLKPGQCVVECGAAPGAWTQVGVQVVHRPTTSRGDSPPPPGLYVACDLLPMEPVDGAAVVPPGDFTLAATQAAILQELNGRRPDLVLSDMAPNVSGVGDLDHDGITTLFYHVLKFALSLSAPGSDLLCKVFAGRNMDRMTKDLQSFYRTLKVVKPVSSRKESREVYFLARNFRGVEQQTYD